MSRITKSLIREHFRLLGSEYLIPKSRKEAEERGEPAFLSLDYYSPGGNPYHWKLCVVSVKNGAEWDINQLRMTNYGFMCYLEGLETSISERFNSFKLIIEKRNI